MSATIATPPAPAPRRVVTPEELLEMGAYGKRFELVNGTLEETPVSFLSSYVAGEVFAALRDHVRSHNSGWVVPENTSFRCFPDDEGKVRRPDTAFIALDRLTVAQALTEGHCPVVPDLVVEVISPNDYAKNVNQKLAEWLAAGAKLVWVIDPDAKTVQGYFSARPNSPGLWREGDTLPGEPVLPGFSVPVADLFRLPSPAPVPTA